MNALPVELLTEILDYLPPSSRKSLRLTSRFFHSVVPRSNLKVLASFIDPKVALSTITTAASDLKRRPKTIWSPRCSVPKDLPIPESFLIAMYVGLSGSRWVERAVEAPQVTPQELALRLDRCDITEENLRQAMFRYVLYLSYTSTGEESPHMWVVNPQSCFAQGHRQAVRAV